MRWSLALQPYHFTIRYIRGEDNFCADYLSRGCAADTEYRYSVRHILLQMCWSTILMDNVFDVIVYVQLHYPSMCVTNYST